MCSAAPLFFAPSQAARVSGLLRSAKSTNSAREYTFASSTASRGTPMLSPRSGEGVHFCAGEIPEIAAISTRRARDRQCRVAIVVSSYPGHLHASIKYCLTGDRTFRRRRHSGVIASHSVGTSTWGSGCSTRVRWNAVCDRVRVWDGREVAQDPWRLPQNHRQSANQPIRFGFHRSSADER